MAKFQSIKAKTIKKALKSSDEEAQIVAVNACHRSTWGNVSIESTDGFTHPVKTMESLFNPLVSLAILARKRDLETFLRLVNYPNATVRKMAWQFLCPYQGCIPSEFIEECLLQETTIISETPPQMDVAYAIAKACGEIKDGISNNTIKRWFEYAFNHRHSQYGKAMMWAATYASIGREIPYRYYEKAFRALCDEKLDEAITKVLRWRRPSVKSYNRFKETYNAKIVTEVYAGRKDALPYFEPLTQYEAPHMVSTGRLVAKSYRGMDISVQHIQELSAEFCETSKFAAMYASIGRRDVPIQTIESVLNYCRNGNHRDLQKVGMIAYMNHPQAQPMREYKAGKVGYWPGNLSKCTYIKCLNDVIAKVDIPETAHICTTATPGEKSNFFYTNEIKVTDIIGDFFGEKVGITDKECTRILRKGEHRYLDAPVFDPFEEQGDPGFKIYLDPDCTTV